MLAGPRPADLVAAFALPLPSTVTCELLGLRRIPLLRLAVPVEEIRFKHESVVYGVHSLPVTC